jgi:adenylate cyclase
MAMEIERKFLLKDASWRHAVISSEKLAQGYLGGEKCSVRVRIAEASAWLNIKRKTMGSSREEFEYEIPLDDARFMLAELAAGPLIEKTRHHVQVHGKHWEIDEFEGENAPRVIAEIELTHVEEPFDRPLWLGEEVTMHRRYYNSELSKRPYAKWSESER